MAIAQAGNASYVNNSGTSTTVQAAGLTAGAGNTQVAFVIGNTAPITFTPPANFSVIDTGSGNNRSWATYKATSSLVANPTFTSSATCLLALVVIEFSGSNGTVDVHSTGFTSNSNVGTSGALTPTQTADAFVMFGANDANTDAVTTAPAGFTEVVPTGGANGSQFSERAWFLVNPALSSQQPSVTWNYSTLTGNTTITAYVVIKAAIHNLSPSDTFPGWADGLSIARTHSAPNDTFPGWTDSVAVTVVRGNTQRFKPFFRGRIMGGFGFRR